MACRITTPEKTKINNSELHLSAIFASQFFYLVLFHLFPLWKWLQRPFFSHETGNVDIIHL